MDKFIITETVNGVTNYISLNNEGQLVSVQKNPLELPGLLTKEQAFKVVTALRQANKDEGTKYRVKAASQALRDYVTDLIQNVLPEKEMVDEAVIQKAVESWKPAVKVEEAPKTEASPEPAEESQPETVEEPAETEAKPEKKSKKQSK